MEEREGETVGCERKEVRIEGRGEEEMSRRSLCGVGTIEGGGNVGSGKGLEVGGWDKMRWECSGVLVLCLHGFDFLRMDGTLLCLNRVVMISGS